MSLSTTRSTTRFFITLQSIIFFKHFFFLEFMLPERILNFQSLDLIVRHCHKTAPLLTCSHSCCTHHKHVGGHPWAGSVLSLQSVLLPSSLLPCPLPFLLSFPSCPVAVIYLHHTDTESASLPIQVGHNPNYDPITSNHIHHVSFPFLFNFLHFLISLFWLSLIAHSLSPFLLSASAGPPFLFPFPFFLLISASLSIFLSLSLSLSPTYRRKTAKPQGNGINFHSRLNSQSISLELNTLPPIRNSQSSISLFPRRHSPAIQRQPWKPCLTCWRIMGGSTGAHKCPHVTNKPRSMNNKDYFFSFLRENNKTYWLNERWNTFRCQMKKQ